MSNRIRKHAQWHESGGLDEIDLANLAGTLGDAQATQFLLLSGGRAMTGDLDLADNKLVHDEFVLKFVAGNDLALMNVAETVYMDLRLNNVLPYASILFAAQNPGVQPKNASAANIKFSTRWGGVSECAQLLTTGSGTGEWNISRAGNITFIASKALLNVDHIEGDEITTPTAVADHWKIYSKTDNKLYFQDGAGTEHEVHFV